MEPTVYKIPYESLDISATELAEGDGERREIVGAYSEGRELTTQQEKDKAALEALMAEATAGAEYSVADAAKKRNEDYQLNSLVTINDNVSVQYTINNTGGTAAASSANARYANNSDGTYLGQFVLTGYCPCVQCCGKSDGVTASGKHATANHTIAADSRYAFGTQMIILGQVYTVEDRGGAINGNHIDIYFNTHAEALQFGKKTADVYLYTGSSASNTASNESSGGGSGSITLIGDSLTVGATAAFQSLAPDANIDGKVGRQMSAGYDIVSSMKSSGTLGDNVIIELGTNGTFSTTAGQSLIDNIGSDRQIYWVNTYGPSLGWYTEVNSVISSLAAANSNVTMVDWASEGMAHPEYFAADGIHMTSEGYSAFARLMYNAVQ